MNLVELLQIASSEEKVEEFLREKGILLGETSTNAIKVYIKWHRRILELCKGEVTKISWCKQGEFYLLSKRA
jgi:hypothetical protein